MEIPLARGPAAGQRHRDAERPGSLEVQEKLHFRGLLYRQLASLFAFENTGGIDAGQTVSVGAAKAEDSADPAREHAVLRELITTGATEDGAEWIERNLSFESRQISCTPVWAETAWRTGSWPRWLIKTSLTIEIDIQGDAAA